MKRENIEKRTHRQMSCQWKRGDRLVDKMRGKSRGKGSKIRRIQETYKERIKKRGR